MRKPLDYGTLSFCRYFSFRLGFVLDLFQSIFLGIVQGLTEFLPVSSSGHLVIFQKWLGVKDHSIAFDVAAHLGTLLAVVTIYWKSIRQVVVETLVFPIKREKTPAVWLFVVVFLGSLPTAIMGLGFKDLYEGLFSNMVAVSLFFMLTGIILFFSDKFQVESEGDGRVDLNDLEGISSITIGKALIIGFIQGLAIAPGVSRSGSTIASSLFLGFRRQTAAHYSFALSVPAVLGAAVLQLRDISSYSSDILVSLGVGLAVSYLAGLVGLMGLLYLVRKGRLRYFSYYLWILGAGTLLFQLV